MPVARFGASKFRNAVPYITPREEWYRDTLPVTGNNPTAASSDSTFSSQIKTNRDWIVTVASSGELSYRSYNVTQPAVSMKGLSRGPVGDWDLSRLEDGMFALGGTDGSVSEYIPVRAETSSLDLSS